MFCFVFFRESQAIRNFGEYTIIWITGFWKRAWGRNQNRGGEGEDRSSDKSLFPETTKVVPHTQLTLFTHTFTRSNNSQVHWQSFVKELMRWMLGKQMNTIWDPDPRGHTTYWANRLRKVLKFALGHAKDSPQVRTDSEPNKTLWLLLRCCVLPPTLPSVWGIDSPPPPALGTFDLWIFHPALIRTRYNPAISMYPPVIPNTQCRKSPMRLGTRGASAIFTATITHWAVYRPELCLDLISVSSCTWLVAPWTVRSPSIMLSQSSQRPVTSAAWISERNTIPSRNCTPNRSWCLLNSKPTFASTLWASQTFGW